jgi:DNA polymerase sigma
LCGKGFPPLGPLVLTVVHQPTQTVSRHSSLSSSTLAATTKALRTTTTTTIKLDASSLPATAMAYSQTLSPSATYRDVHLMQNQPLSTPSSIHASPILQGLQHPRPSTKQRFVAELSQCLFDFVIQLLPTQEEMAVKEDVRKLLERLIRTIEPDSRLLSFGSTANGFSLRNSGKDDEKCCAESPAVCEDLLTLCGC